MSHSDNDLQRKFPENRNETTPDCIHGKELGPESLHSISTKNHMLSTSQKMEDPRYSNPRYMEAPGNQLLLYPMETNKQKHARE